MARTFRNGWWRRLANRAVVALVRGGRLGKNVFVLSVPGRRSGRIYSTPVTLLVRDDGRWLVAPYGVVAWVRNARAAGEVTLSRGGRSERARVVELGPEEAAPLLREYLQMAKVTQPYFDAAPGAPDEAFVAEALRHPVFRLEPAA